MPHWESVGRSKSAQADPDQNFVLPKTEVHVRERYPVVELKRVNALEANVLTDLIQRQGEEMTEHDLKQIWSLKVNRILDETSLRN